MDVKSEIVYQKYIKKPFMEVIRIFEMQNPNMKKETKVEKGKLRVEFTDPHMISSIKERNKRNNRGQELYKG